jgi:hypothetical protein
MTTAAVTARDGARLTRRSFVAWLGQGKIGAWNPWRR